MNLVKTSAELGSVSARLRRHVVALDFEDLQDPLAGASWWPGLPRGSPEMAPPKWWVDLGKSQSMDEILAAGSPDFRKAAQCDMFLMISSKKREHFGDINRWEK